MEREYDIYGGFASVYDLFMDNINYDELFLSLKMILMKTGIDSGIYVEIAC